MLNIALMWKFYIETCFSQLNRATLQSHVALSREGPGPCIGDPGPGTIYIPRPLGRAGLAWDLSRSSLIRSWGPGSGLKTYCLDSHGQGPGAADATWPAASCRGHWCGHRWRQTA